jgi:hypothetical protein
LEGTVSRGIRPGIRQSSRAGIAGARSSGAATVTSSRLSASASHGPVTQPREMRRRAAGRPRSRPDPRSPQEQATCVVIARMMGGRSVQGHKRIYARPLAVPASLAAGRIRQSAGLVQVEAPQRPAGPRRNDLDEIFRSGTANAAASWRADATRIGASSASDPPVPPWRRPAGMCPGPGQGGAWASWRERPGAGASGTRSHLRSYPGYRRAEASAALRPELPGNAERVPVGPGGPGWSTRSTIGVQADLLAGVVRADE